MEVALNFVQNEDGYYYSDPVRLESDAGLELVFPEEEYARSVYLASSFSKENWANFKYEVFPGSTYVTSIAGVPEGVGVWFRVKVRELPVSGKLFVA